MELRPSGRTSIGVEYGDVPMYHAVPSPQGANKDDNGMLEGSTVEVSPEMEAALLQLDAAAGTGPPDRWWHLNSSQVVPRTEDPHALELFLGKPSTTEG